MGKSVLGVGRPALALTLMPALAPVEQTYESAFFQLLIPARLFGGRIAAQLTYQSELARTLLKKERER